MKPRHFLFHPLHLRAPPLLCSSHCRVGVKAKDTGNRFPTVQNIDFQSPQINAPSLDASHEQPAVAAHQQQPSLGSLQYQPSVSSQQQKPGSPQEQPRFSPTQQLPTQRDSSLNTALCQPIPPTNIQRQPKMKPISNRTSSPSLGDPADPPPLPPHGLYPSKTSSNFSAGLAHSPTTPPRSPTSFLPTAAPLAEFAPSQEGSEDAAAKSDGKRKKAPILWV